MPLEALRGAPRSIEVDGVVVQLEAHVWRDFMPGLLSDTDWESRPSEEQPRDPAAHEVVVTMRNGPKWPPKAVVDVVVRVVDTNGATHLLASRALKIEAAM